METVMTERWFIDGVIDLTGICSDSGWSRLAAIEELQHLGLSRPDAEAFVDFRFAVAARFRDASPEDALTEAQWDRLSTT